MTSIGLSLQKDVFQHNNERLMALTGVTKPHKKKKIYFLTIVLNDSNRNVLIYLIKKTDQYYRKHKSWSLSDLRVVDAKCGHSGETPEFELHFNNKQIYKWIANSLDDKYSFIQWLTRLSSQKSSPQRIQFLNAPKESLVSQQESPEIKTLVNGQNGHSEEADEESYQALTAREEADLERLLSQCEFTIHNAEAFTEQLTKEVNSMDSINIQNIMASEQRVLGLMQTLHNAIEETSKLENRISHYETLLKNVREVVLQVEQKEAIVQIQNDNNNKLLIELQYLIQQLNFDKRDEDVLLEGDLTTKYGIALCIQSANVLQKALNANIHPSLSYMSAVQDQRKLLDKTCTKFSSRLSHHLNNLFSHLTNQYSDQFLTIISREELTLPVHSPIHNMLRTYSPLVKWLKINDNEIFTHLMKNYKNFQNTQYEREFGVFFELAKERLSGGRYSVANTTPPQNMDYKRKTLPSSDNRRNSGSITGTPNMSSDYFETSSTRSSEFSLSEWEEFDNCVDRMLSAIDPICLSEQQFCIDFFDLEIGPTIQSNPNQSICSSPSPSHQSQSSNETQDSKRSEQIRPMMSEMFAALEPEFISFATFYDKLDGLYSMYLLVRLTHHVLSAQDTASFLSKSYGNILIQVKRNFDRFMLSQQISIEESKAPKSAKCGVLSFIKRFEIFAKQAENIFKNAVQRRTDIDRWYTILVRSMFEAINRIAKDHHKTPQEIIRLENYHYLHNTLSTLKISCLENERKEAKNRYNESLKDYVKRYFGRPLEKLNIFFEGVQQKVAQGVKAEEIGYQLAFSKQELRKIIKDCNLKEVKKGLEDMYRKVEKHTCEPTTTLIQVIWRSMQEEFIIQYKTIQEMIERCYPDANITLLFTIDDVLNVFSEIAQSH
ncbi:exocyst complex component 1-like [Oppia nitens]|uniref:exocyst complex component 1-like n=1 Tax=Oppia nitens TaxID=1686743 RepID=UPI0023DB3AB0|nr:exocyst complex component 1-like [Oppia nitens]